MVPIDSQHFFDLAVDMMNQLIGVIPMMLGVFLGFGLVSYIFGQIRSLVETEAPAKPAEIPAGRSSFSLDMSGLMEEPEKQPQPRWYRFVFPAKCPSCLAPIVNPPDDSDRAFCTYCGALITAEERK